MKPCAIVCTRTTCTCGFFDPPDGTAPRMTHAQNVAHARANAGLPVEGEAAPPVVQEFPGARDLSLARSVRHGIPVETLTFTVAGNHTLVVGARVTITTERVSHGYMVTGIEAGTDVRGRPQSRITATRLEGGEASPAEPAAITEDARARQMRLLAERLRTVRVGRTFTIAPSLRGGLTDMDVRAVIQEVNLERAGGVRPGEPTIRITGPRAVDNQIRYTAEAVRTININTSPFSREELRSVVQNLNEQLGDGARVVADGPSRTRPSGPAAEAAPAPRRRAARARRR